MFDALIKRCSGNRMSGLIRSLHIYIYFGDVIVRILLVETPGANITQFPSQAELQIYYMYVLIVLV